MQYKKKLLIKAINCQQYRTDSELVNVINPNTYNEDKTITINKSTNRVLIKI